MSDLISKSEVLELLYKIFDKYYMSTDKNPSIISKSFGTESFGIDVFKEIKKMPTAYDIDKVVEELEKRKALYERLVGYESKNGTSTEKNQHIKAIDVLNDAIEIVKAGGKNE